MRVFAGIAAVAIGASVGPLAAIGSPGDAARPGAILFKGGPDGGLYVVRADGTGLRRVTPGINGGASWSPDGRQIAYVTGVDFSADTVRVRDARSGVERRASGSGSAASEEDPPSWSPDGAWIAYEAARGIAVSRPDGTERHVLYVGRGDVWREHRKPSWSPDGSMIAFAYERAFEDEVVVVLRRDGSDRRTFATQTCSYGGGPSWSPDGTAIAYVTEGASYAGGKLVLVAPDGTRERTIATNVTCEAPAWSPDASSLAYSKEDGVYVASVSGGRARRLGTGPATTPVWSPDGGVIAFTARGDIWTVPVAGGRVRRITQGWRYGYGNDLQLPAWRGVKVESIAGASVAWQIPTDSVVTGGELRTTGRVDLLAADGDRVAVSYASGRDDYCIELWNTRSGRLTRFICPPTDAGGIYGLAVAGTRVALLHYNETNHSVYTLYLASELVPAPIEISEVEDDASIYGLVADRQLIAFAIVAIEPPGNTRIVRAARTGNVLVTHYSREAQLLHADRGRLVTRPSASQVEVRRARDGRLVRRVTTASRRAVFAGNLLLVERDRSIDVFSLTSGARVRTLEVRRNSTLVDAEQSLAAIVGKDRSISVVDVLTGRETVLRPTGMGQVLASLEPAGLFIGRHVPYSRYPGRVSLVPWRVLVRRLS